MFVVQVSLYCIKHKKATAIPLQHKGNSAHNKNEKRIKSIRSRSAEPENINENKHECINPNDVKSEQVKNCWNAQPKDNIDQKMDTQRRFNDKSSTFHFLRTNSDQNCVYYPGLKTIMELREQKLNNH